MTPRHLLNLARQQLVRLKAMRDEIDQQIACLELLFRMEKEIDNQEDELRFFRRRELERLEQSFAPPTETDITERETSNRGSWTYQNLQWKPTEDKSKEK